MEPRWQTWDQFKQFWWDWWFVLRHPSKFTRGDIIVAWLLAGVLGVFALSAVLLLLA